METTIMMVGLFYSSVRGKRMKTKEVQVRHPADGGKSTVIIDPYYEIGDRVLVGGDSNRPAEVTADHGARVFSSADGWVEQVVTVQPLDEEHRPIPGPGKSYSSGDLRPIHPGVYRDAAGFAEVPF
jgi:hypothetical protein